ncbi:N-acetyltransferase [Corynebacterium sp. MSK039]|uniref:GNAT family N-acetyltransferase n=1 Tax=Corynebacterium sp. MSK039 TaxID=3050193 RepID=UPI002550A897|nr:N-acetyltransferase [Corynebacterium sp. MSK039]MDK8791219.1 N-acetyltransferase [Corynebacterium sp. MSK039]
MSQPIAQPDQDHLVSLAPISRAVFLRRLDELVALHLKAMGYPPEAFRQRRSLWLSNANHPHFTSLVALLHSPAEEPDPANPAQKIVGVCFGFQGSRGTWWYQQVSYGLLASGMPPEDVTETLSSYTEISEIHVLPRFQGSGIGTRLLTEVLGILPTRDAMLSTPEVPGENNHAWHLYRSLGFTDLLREHRFPGDPRPFGILRKRLRDSAGDPAAVREPASDADRAAR